jgi:SAM-dependent methyltransferase
VTRDVPGKYLLGHRRQEWDRLEQQHLLWRDSLLDPIRALGMRADAAILEIVCGPGALLAELATLGEGPLAAIELDPEAANVARERLAGRAEVRQGDVNRIDLAGPWDLIVLRWVFSFLPDPRATLARVWAATRPGGYVVIQDYDHDGFAIWPHDPAIERVIEAFRAAYRASGGDLWVGPKLPQWFAELGARPSVKSEVRADYVDGDVWRWVERFLLEHVDNVVLQGQLTPAEREAFLAAWHRARHTPGALLVSPIQITSIARRR